MILNSIDTQFTLNDAGEICWQKDMTNPIPGEPIAHVQKGETILEPSCQLMDVEVINNDEKDAVKKHIETWLHTHIKTILEALFLLKAEDIPTGSPREICDKIIDSMGTVLRSDLQDLIGAMSEEERNSLRSKKIRFGPLIVYLPLLNKPAAVRLRAMLLTLWQDKKLPAVVPVDGIVSYSIEGQEIDHQYYRAIGYPVYGPRAIRVDMLDRVICAVYDAAEEGKFQAQHQMAEWLGSNIDDLYLILTAMGHKKIEPKPEIEASQSEEKPAEENAETSTEEKSEEVKESKPELATFWLKRGKASDSNKKPARNNKDKKVKNFKQKKKKPAGKKEPRERVYTAEAKSNPADSPFAILEQLKSSQKDG